MVILSASWRDAGIAAGGTPPRQPAGRQRYVVLVHTGVDVERWDLFGGGVDFSHDCGRDFGNGLAEIPCFLTLFEKLQLLFRKAGEESLAAGGSFQAGSKLGCGRFDAGRRRWCDRCFGRFSTQAKIGLEWGTLIHEWGTLGRGGEGPSDIGSFLFNQLLLEVVGLDHVAQIAGSDLQAVEHDAGVFGLHGAHGHGMEHTLDAELDAFGGVEGPDYEQVDAVEFFVPVAEVRIALCGRAAAQSVGMVVTASGNVGW